MPRKFQPFRVIKKNYRLFNKRLLLPIKKQLNWLLRTIFLNKTQRRSTANAGFVLPTVAMVILVVVLLTAAILFRSFDRAKNASNVRVNEAVLAAATPALDRARAKLDQLFSEPGLPREKPSDTQIEQALQTNINKYTFGDETQLQLSSGSDTLKTAWMYPIDTNNNGKYDTYTLYGIYFKSPTAGSARTPLEARTPPIDVTKNDVCSTNSGGDNSWYSFLGKSEKSFFVYTTTAPITAANKPAGTAGTNYEIYNSNKAFSALEYQQDRQQLAVNDAVVYDNDIELTPGTDFYLNGRIVTNGNLLIAPGYSNSVKLFQVSSTSSCFYNEANSRIIVGGNLTAGGFTAPSYGYSGTAKIHLWQATNYSETELVPSGSTPSGESVVAGTTRSNSKNVAYNDLAYVQRLNLLVNAQLVNAASTDPDQVKQGTGTRADELYFYFKQRTRRVPYAEVAFNGNALSTYTTSNVLQGSGNTLRPPDQWIYPDKPTDSSVDGINAAGYDKLTLNTNGSGSNKYLSPPASEPDPKIQSVNQDEERYSTESNLGERILVGNNLPEVWWNNSTSSFIEPPSSSIPGIDQTISNKNQGQSITGVKWDGSSDTRLRKSRVRELKDLGNIDRDGFWELASDLIAATNTNPDPSSEFEWANGTGSNSPYVNSGVDFQGSARQLVGGLRVVTGAGIYLPSSISSLTSSLTAASSTIWSDMMPVPSNTATSLSDSGGPSTTGSSPTYLTSKNVLLDPTPTNTVNIPYLRMRATAVYHYNYAQTIYNAKNPTPIACVSSYYDPTNKITARNQTGLSDVPSATTITSLSSSDFPGDGTNVGNSNNGVVYGPPTKSVTNYQALLNYQAQLKYANGRWVNELLNSAYGKSWGTTTNPLTLAEQSAVDAEICSLQILDGSITHSTTVIPDGAIFETAFLDARQIKAIHKDNPTTTVIETFTNADNGASVDSNAYYDLPIQQRQPLEIRATVLDVNALRTTAYSTDGTGATEYLLPVNGIIYASRNDALADKSALSTGTGNTAQTQKTQSPADSILDPTRRPNAIMLINGSQIFRSTTNDYAHDNGKGLVLASNLPVYVKGNFNLHDYEEFTQTLHDGSASGTTLWDNFYTRSTLDTNFACRKGDTSRKGCSTGDSWRPASVVADAITVLSSDFRFGFRQDGDYDLNNNLGDGTSISNFQQSGLDNNNYVVNNQWYPATDSNNNYYPNSSYNSSYFNNFVTPIQRRTYFNEYLMEVCPKLPASACGVNDWYVDPSSNKYSWNSGVIGGLVSSLKSGTTAQPAASAYQGYPRRVAFQRNSDGTLVQDNNPGNYTATTNGKTYYQPILLGIDTSGKVQTYNLSQLHNPSTNPRKVDHALWFHTLDIGGHGVGDAPDNAPTLEFIDPDTSLSFVHLDTPSQPTSNIQIRAPLTPILQIKTPFGNPITTKNAAGNDVAHSDQNKLGPNNSGQTDEYQNWLQTPTADTTVNLISAVGDTPARSNEDNGGLSQLVRLLEHWNPQSSISAATKLKISGAFYQIKRSSYATGPFSSILSDSYLNTGNANDYSSCTSTSPAGCLNEGYRIATSDVLGDTNTGSSSMLGTSPFFVIPNQLWGYDVGLLSQGLNLLTAAIQPPPSYPSNEFFREVGRDDNWVQTLLCAKQIQSDGTAGSYAVDATMRPASCPSS